MKKLFTILTVMLLTACSAGKGAAAGGYASYSTETAYEEKASYGYAESNAAYDAAPMEEAADYEGNGYSGAGNGVMVPADIESQEKIVYTGHLSIETKQYDETLQTLNDRLAEFGGLISSSNENASRTGLRTVYMTLRIPSAHFSTFMGGASVLGNVRSKSTSRNDITKQYSDRSIEAQALQTQLDKLTEMLEKAQTIEEMLMIEDRIVSVETRLNMLRSVIGNMDMDVAYSTVDIALSEVLQYSSDIVERRDETFFDRLNNAVQDSARITSEVLETVFFTLIRFAPLIAIAAVLLYGYRSWRRKHPRAPGRSWSFRKKKETPEE